MNTSNSLTVHFWGVRGSYPVPGAGAVNYGGNTACVEVQAGGRTIIFDAGTGIIGLGRELADRARQSNTPLEATLLFSHLHHDHTQGFPFFTPAYIPSARLHLFGPGPSATSLQDALDRNQTPPVFPVRLSEMSASLEITSLKDGDVVLIGEQGAAVQRLYNTPVTDDAVVIRSLRSYAHPGGVLAYRLGWRGVSMVYATDTEGYVGGDRRLAAFARGADLLIHDAQYADEHYRGQLPGFPVTQGYGHSTPSIACELAAAAGVKQLVLFHHDPNYDDLLVASLEAQAQGMFPNVAAAYEGMELSVISNQLSVISLQSLISTH